MPGFVRKSLSACSLGVHQIKTEFLSVFIQPKFEFSHSAALVEMNFTQWIGRNTFGRIDDVQIGSPMMPRSAGYGTVLYDFLNGLLMRQTSGSILFVFSFPYSVLVLITAVTRNHEEVESLFFASFFH